MRGAIHSFHSFIHNRISGSAATPHGGRDSGNRAVDDTPILGTRTDPARQPVSEVTVESTSVTRPARRAATRRKPLVTGPPAAPAMPRVCPTVVLLKPRSNAGYDPGVVTHFTRVRTRHPARGRGLVVNITVRTP